jgi:putative PIG3 family NAD(P)H quinone oxidoreductase
MRAVVIAGSGGVEVLEIREGAKPSATGDRVLVRVHAAGLNRGDILQRRGFYPPPPGASAEIPGIEFAGEIDQCGENVQNWKPGQRVFGITGGGAQAEYITVPESHVAEIPSNLSFVEAAAVPEVFVTAHDALFTQAQFTLGETVLVHAAGSGVGTAAIQLARSGGAAAVYGTARTAEKIERTREYGLDKGLVVGDNPLVFADAVRDWTGGRGVDVILDLVGASYLAANLEALGLRGRMMLIGTLGGSSAAMDYRKVMVKRLSIKGTVLRARSVEEKASAVRRFAHSVVPLLARGDVRPVIDRVFPLEEIRGAHERLESNATFGKIVLAIR